MRNSFLMTGVIALMVSACGGGAQPTVPDTDAAPNDVDDATPDVVFDATPDVADVPDVPDVVDAGRACASNDDCTAADLCTNAQICRNNRCITIGGAATCDDGIACTSDSCDATRGRCVHEADDMRCPSGQFCDRTAITGGCVRELPCEIGDRSCERLQGDPCTGTWSCDPARLRCVRSAPYNCDDMDMCTTDVCMVSGTAPMCSHSGPMYDSDVMNCGACRRACRSDLAHVTPTCAMGMCSYTCEMRYVDLNRDLMAATSDGCECDTTATDDPDLMFQDTNCDGIDGDASRAVFVSPRGNDGNPGTREMPKLTMAAAITTARMMSKSVYAAMGLYMESVTLQSGVSVYGGYDDMRGWARSRANTTTIRGSTTAVTATGLTAPTELQLLSIASAAGVGDGVSSYGVRVINTSALLTIRACTITSGNGSSGANGSNGATGAAGGNGSGGGTPDAGGGGGSSCSASGGNGGAGRNGLNSGYAGGPGGQTSGGATGGSGGAGGTLGRCTLTSSSPGSAAPSPGSSGGATNGTNGSAGLNGRAAAAVGTINGATGDYTAPDGTNGSSGQHGGGGGGGGGGGASQHGCGFLNSSCRDSTSGGGGGGGGAGCAGGPGTAGGGGGASFGVMSVSSQLRIEGCTVTSGRGGNGGRGGAGGRGGNGGHGGSGGGSTSNAAGGGAGAEGGAGGAGGNASGGTGGPSVCVYYLGVSPMINMLECNLGGGGIGGSGGSNGYTSDAPDGANGLSEQVRAGI